MKIQNTRERLLASSMICGAAFLGLSATHAAAAAAAADATAGEVSEIVVTGTRIPSPNLTSIAPIATVGNADIKAQGVTRIEEKHHRQPSSRSACGRPRSPTARPAPQQVDDLRAQPSRTLVLVDGRRLMPGDPLQVSASADLDFVPAALVERIDVLTGGASATYGADAVAGVVNFIMLKNFEGVRIDAQYSATSTAANSRGLVWPPPAQHGHPLAIRRCVAKISGTAKSRRKPGARRRAGQRGQRRLRHLPPFNPILEGCF